MMVLREWECHAVFVRPLQSLATSVQHKIWLLLLSHDELFTLDTSDHGEIRGSSVWLSPFVVVRGSSFWLSPFVVVRGSSFWLSPFVVVRGSSFWLSPFVVVRGSSFWLSPFVVVAGSSVCSSPFVMVRGPSFRCASCVVVCWSSQSPFVVVVRGSYVSLSVSLSLSICLSVRLSLCVCVFVSHVPDRYPPPPPPLHPQWRVNYYMIVLDCSPHPALRVAGDILLQMSKPLPHNRVSGVSIGGCYIYIWHYTVATLSPQEWLLH